jgi:hypothetical protein
MLPSVIAGPGVAWPWMSSPAYKETGRRLSSRRVITERDMAVRPDARNRVAASGGYRKSIDRTSTRVSEGQRLHHEAHPSR